MYSTLSFLKKTKKKQCSTKSIRNGRQVHFNTRKNTGNDRWLFLFLPLLPSEETTIHPEQKNFKRLTKINKIKRRGFCIRRHYGLNNRPSQDALFREFLRQSYFLSAFLLFLIFNSIPQPNRFAKRLSICDLSVIRSPLSPVGWGTSCLLEMLGCRLFGCSSLADKE